MTRDRITVAAILITAALLTAALVGPADRAGRWTADRLFGPRLATAAPERDYDAAMRDFYARRREMLAKQDACGDESIRPTRTRAELQAEVQRFVDVQKCRVDALLAWVDAEAERTR